MPDHERLMLTFARLAAESIRRRQAQGTVRFLLLTGIAAARAGWPAVSCDCRERVLQQNPAHLIGNYDSVEAALRDAAFAPFVRHLERFCSYERGEMLLDGIDPEWRASIAPGNDATAGEHCLKLLAGEA